jgi:hypothetical protein
MAQESTPALNTQNTSGGLFGGFFGGITDLIKGAAPVATNLYTLKLQGQQLSQNLVSQQQLLALQQQQELAKTTGTQTSVGATFKPWLPYILGGLGLLLVLLVIRRRSK